MTSLSNDNDRYAQLYEDFRWHVPALFNIAEVCCARWARDANTAARVAIHYEHENGQRARITYAGLQEAANRLSHALERLGVTLYKA